MKTDNELIAEFFGETVYQDNDEMQKVPIEDLSPYLFKDQLKYNTSWDWLMPVVEKIENSMGSVSVQIINRYCQIQKHDSPYFLSTTDIQQNKITATFNAVVEFIKWYNSQIK